MTRRPSATPRLAVLFLATFLGSCGDQLLPPTVEQGMNGDEIVYYATTILRQDGKYDAGSTFTVPASGMSPATPHSDAMMVCKPRNGLGLYLRFDPAQGAYALCLRRVSDGFQLWQHLIGGDEAFYSADFSADGETVVYQFLSFISPKVQSHISILRTDGSGQCLKLTGGADPSPFQGNYQGPTFAPTGNKLAFVESDPFNNCSIMILGIGPSVSISQLFPVDVSYINGAGLSWSPAGDKIAFIGQGYSGRRNIYVVDVNTYGTMPPTPAVALLDFNSTLVPACPVWSPDGSTIAFVASDKTTQNDIWTVGVTGTGLRRITSTPDISESSVQWSPEGTRFLSLVVPAGITEIYNTNGILEVVKADGSKAWPIAYDVNRGFWGN